MRSGRMLATEYFHIDMDSESLLTTEHVTRRTPFRKGRGTKTEWCGGEGYKVLRAVLSTEH